MILRTVKSKELSQKELKKDEKSIRSKQKTMTSLKDKIQEMAGDTDVTDFDNLILDEDPLERLTAADKTYLETFTKLEMISLNSCRMQTLENFPVVASLTRVELSENQIKGSDLAHLARSTSITTLKLANNKIGTMSELEALKALTSLTNLDLEGNPVCEKDDYDREKIFEMLPSLEVLDMVTKDGEDFQSELEDYGLEEGGEDEIDVDDFEADAALLEQQLSETQKSKLAAAGITIKDYLAGNGPDLTEEEYGDEEGEEDVDGEEPEEEGDEGVNGDKRAREE